MIHFSTVSVSVSMIHFGCISIINHWYMTVIHLLEFRTLYWQGCNGILHPECPQLWLCVVSRIKDFPDSSHALYRHYREVEDDFFDGTTTSTDAAISAVERECTSTTWVTLTLNWKCWQDAVESLKFSLNSTQLYHHLYQLKDCSTRLNRSKCHATTVWLTDSMFENLLPLTQTMVYFRTEGFHWLTTICVST